MKHLCPECGVSFEDNWDGPLILKCTLCLAVANVELLAAERYPDQGDQAVRHAQFVRETFRKSKDKPNLQLS